MSASSTHVRPWLAACRTASRAWMRRTVRAEPEIHRAKIGLEDRLDHDRGWRHDHPVGDRGDAERARLARAWGYAPAAAARPGRDPRTDSTFPGSPVIGKLAPTPPQGRGRGGPLQFPRQPDQTRRLPYRGPWRLPRAGLPPAGCRKLRSDTSCPLPCVHGARAAGRTWIEA